MNRLFTIVFMIVLLLLIQLIVSSVVPIAAVVEIVLMYVVYRTWRFGIADGRIAFAVAVVFYLLLGRFTMLTTLVLWCAWLTYEQISMRLLTSNTSLSHMLQSIVIVLLVESIAYAGDITAYTAMIFVPPTFFVVASINMLALYGLYVGAIQRRDTLHMIL